MKLSVTYEIEVDDSEAVTGEDNDDDGIWELLKGTRNFLKHAIKTARNVTPVGSDKIENVVLVSMKQINPNPNSTWANHDWALTHSVLMEVNKEVK